MEKIWLYAAIGGFLPAIIWLIFWMNEDKCHPEPKRIVLKTFIFGAFSAFFAIFIQLLFSQINLITDYKVFIFAFIEESVKFFAFIFAVFTSKWNNERSDPLLYMIITALGFAAIENMFYIIDFISNKEYMKTLLDGSYRFIGATILHVISSATIGLFISFVYLKKRYIQFLMGILGLIFASIIHFFFNILVMSKNEIFQDIAFASSWILVILFLAIFELLDNNCKVKNKK